MSESRGIRQAQIAWRPEIIALLEGRASANQIAEYVGCSVPMVYKVAHEVGHQWKLPKPIEQKPVYDNQAYARGKVEEEIPDFEYVDGYNNFEGSARIKCKSCGDITERSWQAIRSGKVICRNCVRIANEKREQERLLLLCEREEDKRIKRFLAEKEEWLRKLHSCPICGKKTTRRVYCSEKCANRVENKKRELKRNGLIKERMVDKDITVPSLFKRDGGVCYLCGKPCRMDDFIVKDGTIICGDWYPSIDHVVPLARGGLHAWENVRLAHRICNSMKRDNPPDSP